MTSRRAFTLIELLVVISIIALLASVVLANLNAARDKARLGAARAFAGNVYRADADLALGIWDFSEGTSTTAIDRSGNGYTGTLVNSPVWSPEVPFGSGYSLLFNGTNQYMSTAVDRTGLTALTVSVWYKFTGGTGDGYRALIGGPSTDFYIGKNSGGTNLAVQDGNYNSAVAVGTNAWDGNWHHLAYVYGSGTGTLYLDGRIVGSASFSGGTGQLWVGLENEGAGYYFKGYVDEPRFFNKTLTAAEVGNLYASGAFSHPLSER